MYKLVWIDATQLEEGTKPTYKVTSLQEIYKIL